MVEGFLENFLFLLGLVLVNCMFVAAEFAIARSNPQHFRSPDGRNRFGAKTALRLMEEGETSLAGTQLAISGTCLLLGWWAEKTFFGPLVMLSSLLGLKNLDPEIVFLIQGSMVIAALMIAVFLNVVFAELVAKSIALRYPEGTLRALGGLIFLFSQVCRPAIFILNSSARVVLRLFGIPRMDPLGRVQSLAELSLLVAKSTEDGVIDKEEEEMLRGVFSLSDTVAREIMTPRTDLVTIDADATLDEVLHLIRESGLSRFPVVGESIDDVLGVLLARDLLSFALPQLLPPREHPPGAVIPIRPSGKSDDFSVRKLMREAYFVPGTKAIDDLLSEFKTRKFHLAVVLDEHGGVDGVVTLEDLIEEIVGDIFDESDVPERSVVVEENGSVLIDGGQLVADVNSQFALEIPEGDYDTIAGFIFTQLGRMPRPGDSILVNVASEKFEDSNAEEEEEPTTSSQTQLLVPERQENDDEEPPPQARIIVERVQSYRIESVRLEHPQYQRRDSESKSKAASSQPTDSRGVEAENTTKRPSQRVVQ